MTREHDETSHPAPHRSKVTTYETLFSVGGAVAAWFVQFNIVYAFATTPCFEAGERVPAAAPAHLLPLIASIACLLVGLAATWLAVVLLRRTRNETGGGEHRLFETGHGRTRYLALWGIAFSTLFTALIAINIVAQLGFQTCAG